MAEAAVSTRGDCERDRPVIKNTFNDEDYFLFVQPFCHYRFFWGLRTCLADKFLLIMLLAKRVFEFVNKTGISIESFIRIFVLYSSCVS